MMPIALLMGTAHCLPLPLPSITAQEYVNDLPATACSLRICLCPLKHLSISRTFPDALQDTKACLSHKGPKAYRKRILDVDIRPYLRRRRLQAHLLFPFIDIIYSRTYQPADLLRSGSRPFLALQDR
jgi:hypothetical protein